MSDYTLGDLFHHSAPGLFDDNDEGSEGNHTNHEHSDELEGQNAYPTPQASQEQPALSQAGLNSADTNFNCHNNPISEITCIKNQICGIKNWSQTVNDTEPIMDLLASLEGLTDALDILMEEAIKGDEMAYKHLTKQIIHARKEVVSIGLKAKKMEVVLKQEQSNVNSLQARVKKFVGEMVKKPSIK